MLSTDAVLREASQKDDANSRTKNPHQGILYIRLSMSPLEIIECKFNWVNDRGEREKGEGNHMNLLPGQKVEEFRKILLSRCSKEGGLNWKN